MVKYLSFFLLLYCSLSSAQVSKIKVWESLYNNPDRLMMDYLQRALQVTIPEYGDYELTASAQMEQGRSLVEIAKLEHSKLDIAVFGSTKEREEVAIPIRIPGLSGLMGYRICLIKEGNQTIFDGIKNKHQLIEKNITIGQHQDWPDTTILRANHISVQTTHKKQLLFQQLIRGRFDCFSRGTSEVYAEYLKYKEQGIIIEKNLMIYYPLPLFFFVNKSRPELAARLQLGLQRLIESGEFDSMFEQVYAPIIKELKLTERTVIDLNNPTLSDETVEAMREPTQRFRNKHLLQD
ncbi:transporter substrate-binding domain-containing protein [Psychromonas sp. MME2]|uniref:transporter substrate-binding domain-containing protein n=1 Tax=unclassified Psychromonas TaxID=2614957 RepID=UPI00339C5370